MSAKGVTNFSIDLGAISKYLGWLPDAAVTIQYAVNGASTTKLDIAPITAFGPLANLDLQPRASMTASGRGTWGVNLLNIGLVNAEIWTEGDVAVLAPGSNAKINVAYAFGSKRAIGKAALDLRALKGRVAYKATTENPVTAPLEIACLFQCDILPITVASGSAWDSSTRYALYRQQPDVWLNLFDVTLN